MADDIFYLLPCSHSNFGITNNIFRGMSNGDSCFPQLCINFFNHCEGNFPLLNHHQGVDEVHPQPFCGLVLGHQLLC